VVGKALIFYIGLHHPSDACHFERACISINCLKTRKKPLCARLLIDSGAFTEVVRHGGYRSDVADYARQLLRLAGGIAEIDAAVAQDYMCEDIALQSTGLTIADHQRLTIERYDRLIDEELPCPIMPVLQGYEPDDYARHAEAYGERLGFGLWTGVGSICKRNGRPNAIIGVLRAIRRVRPDLRLHGFGLKSTALAHIGIRELLASADSMAWSYAARREGRNANSWLEAKTFAERVSEVPADLFYGRDRQ